jgi:hypothetical protein
MRGGPKEKRGEGQPSGLKLFSFLNFWLLFFQEKSDRKQERGSDSLFAMFDCQQTFWL